MAASWLERDGRLCYPPLLVLIRTRLPPPYALFSKLHFAIDLLGDYLDLRSKVVARGN